MLPFELEEIESLFRRALPADAYLDTDPTRADAWRRHLAACALSDTQRAVLSTFVRRMHVLVLSGIWCGDCVQQGPLLQRIAGACDRIDLRFIERDSAPRLQHAVRINGGDRVPVAIFLAEDFEPVSVFGDRTLHRYRAIAARSLGPSCPLPGAPLDADEASATLQDWLNEFERVHLLLRLSPRLRARHGD